MNMWNWMIENKEWLFSGILIAVPIAVISWLISSNNKSKIQKSGKNSTNIQADRDVNINTRDVNIDESKNSKIR